MIQKREKMNRITKMRKRLNMKRTSIELQCDDGVITLLHASFEDVNSDHYGSDFEDSGFFSA